MPVNTLHRTKARSMDLIMKNPQLRRLIKDAWSSPTGSSKRENAKHVVSIMTKLHGVQTDPGVSHMQVEENPWAHLPAHRPVLNYAMHAPKPMKGEAADGMGGPGPSWAPLDTGSLSGLSSPFQSADPALSSPDRLSAERLAEKKSIYGPNYGAPGSFVIPQGPATPSKTPLGTTSPATSFQSLGSVRPMDIGTGRSVQDIDAEIASSRTQPDLTGQGLFSVHGDVSKGFTTGGSALGGYIPPSISIQRPNATPSGATPVKGAFTLPPGVKTSPLRTTYPSLSEGPQREGAKGPVYGPERPSVAAPPSSSVSTQKPSTLQFYTKPEDQAAATQKLASLGIDTNQWRTTVDQAFQKGTPWGTVFDYFRQQLPQTFSNTDIDNFLDTKWKNAGASEAFKSGTSQQGSIPAGTANPYTPGTPEYTTFQSQTASGAGPSYPGISAGMSASSSTTRGSSTTTPSTITVPSSAPSGTLPPGSTGSTGILGRYDLNSVPGLDINAPENAGLTMTEYETKALNTLSQMDDAKWNQAFPGIPKPQGASLSGQIDALIQMKKKDLGLDDLLKQRTDMLNSNPTFVQDARDYVVEHDQQMKQIDSMLDDVKSMPTPDDPSARGLLGAYSNYLNLMKGKTAQRYSTYLTKAVDVRNQEATRLDTEISQAQQDLSMALPTIQAKATEDFSRVLKIIDENAQKPALAAQMARQASKDQLDTVKTNLDIMKATADIGKMGGTNTDDFYKAKDAILKDVTDPTTKGWKMSNLDLVKYGNDYNVDPNALLATMKDVMPMSINSMYADRKNTIKDPVPKGGLTSVIDEVNGYEGAIRGLNESYNATLSQLQQSNPQDPRIAQIMGFQGKLKDVQVEMSKANYDVFNTELGAKWKALEPEIASLASKAGGWFGGSAKGAKMDDPSTKSKWIGSTVAKTKLDPAILDVVWNTIANATAAAGGPAGADAYIKSRTSASVLSQDMVQYIEGIVSNSGAASLMTGFSSHGQELTPPQAPSPNTGY